HEGSRLTEGGGQGSTAPAAPQAPGGNLDGPLPRRYKTAGGSAAQGDLEEPTMTLPQERRRLDEDGFVVLPGFMSGDLLARLRERLGEVFAEEGELAGAEFKLEPGCRRLANLVDKGEVFREVIALPALLEVVRHV